MFIAQEDERLQEFVEEYFTGDSIAAAMLINDRLEEMSYECPSMLNFSEDHPYFITTAYYNEYIGYMRDATLSYIILTNARRIRDSIEMKEVIKKGRFKRYQILENDLRIETSNIIGIAQMSMDFKID